MGANLPIRCFCGAVQGTISDLAPDHTNRVVCHCRYCEAFAHELGHPDKILDDWAGSERIQISPAALRITHGAENLACVHLTPKGGLRWHASCCGTPLALTLSAPQVPFLAVDRCCIDPSTVSLLEETVGPIRARVNGSFSPAQAKSMKATFRDLLRMLLHYTPILARWWWRGDQKKGPFFDPRTMTPVVEPQLLRTPQLARVTSRRAEEQQRDGSLRTAKGCG